MRLKHSETPSMYLNIIMLNAICKIIWLVSLNGCTFATGFGQWFDCQIKKQVTQLTIIHLPGLSLWQHTWGVFSFKGGCFGIL